jgi:hypothetical protein
MSDQVVTTAAKLKLIAVILPAGGMHFISMGRGAILRTVTIDQMIV